MTGLLAGAAFALTRPPADPPQRTADPARLLDVAEDIDREFRVGLSGPELARLLEPALEAESELDTLSLDVASGEDGGALLGAGARLTGSGLPVRADLRVHHDGGGLGIVVESARVAGVPVPASAVEGLDGMDDAADLGGLLSGAGVHLSEVTVEDGDLVLAGAADDPEALASQLRAAVGR